MFETQRAMPNQDLTVPYDKDLEKIYKEIFPQILAKAKAANGVPQFQKTMQTFLLNISNKYSQDQILQLRGQVKYLADLMAKGCL